MNGIPLALSMTVQLATALGGPTRPILENDDSSPMDHPHPRFLSEIFLVNDLRKSWIQISNWCTCCSQRQK